MEKTIAQDLDNNLITKEVYSGITDTRQEYTTKQQSESDYQLSSPPIKTVQIASDEEGFQPPVLPLNPTIRSTLGTVGSDITDVTNGAEIEEDVVITDNETTTTTMSGGGGGGGGGGMPVEDEPPMLRTKEECQILNIECKLFYGLLAVMAIGGYLYYKNNKSVKGLNIK